MQILLRHEPDLVTGAARLLREVLSPASPGPSAPLGASSLLQAGHQQHPAPSNSPSLPAASPALSRLYLSGALYFALLYTGSNLDETAALLRACHLRQVSGLSAFPWNNWGCSFISHTFPFSYQAFRGVPQASDAGLPLSQRSYLGHVLPESLLHILEVQKSTPKGLTIASPHTISNAPPCNTQAYGPSAFASALAGDSDTPEVVWGHSMRMGRLVPQVWNIVVTHLSSFSCPCRCAVLC